MNGEGGFKAQPKSSATMLPTSSQTELSYGMDIYEGPTMCGQHSRHWGQISERNSVTPLVGFTRLKGEIDKQVNK